MDTFQTINVSDLFSPVDTRWTKPDHQKLLDQLSVSVHVDGVMTPILVKKADGVINSYIVLDGVGRLKAAKRCGITEVPCLVREGTDAELEMQSLISSHAHTPVDPVGNARVLKSLLNRDMTMTVRVLADKCGLTEADVQSRLNRLVDYDAGRCTDGRCVDKYRPFPTHHQDCWRVERCVDCTASVSRKSSHGDCKELRCWHCECLYDARRFGYKVLICPIDQKLLDCHGRCQACNKFYEACGKCHQLKVVGEWCKCRERQCTSCGRSTFDIVEGSSLCSFCLTGTKCSNCTNRSNQGSFNLARGLCTPCAAKFPLGNCNYCGVLLDDKLSEHTKRCLACSKLSPAKRGLVLCLESNCRTWIKKPEPSGSTTFGPRFKSTAWFCRKHGNISKTIDTFPMVDRDGDQIWVTASFCIIKVKLMEESHLTNSINFLVTAAQRRAEIVGNVGDWQRYTIPRYQFLVDEAKRRANQPPTCPVCVDGVIGNEVERETSEGQALSITETTCPHCARGKERLVAHKVALEMLETSRRSQTKLTLATASVFFVTFIIGGLAKNGAGFLQLVMHYLQQAGVQ